MTSLFLTFLLADRGLQQRSTVTVQEVAGKPFQIRSQVLKRNKWIG